MLFPINNKQHTVHAMQGVLLDRCMKISTRSILAGIIPEPILSDKRVRTCASVLPLPKVHCCG